MKTKPAPASSRTTPSAERPQPGSGHGGGAAPVVTMPQILVAMLAFRDGDFSQRLPPEWTGGAGKIADTFNDLLTISERRAREAARVCRLGGKFAVTSQVGVGSTFRFDVRVSRAQATAAAAERAAAPVLVRLRPGQPPCRVLIVDDRPKNCALLVQLLAPVGFEIRTAAGGAEAVAQCQAWAPRLVLMDLRMPGRDGHEATRRI